MPNHVHLLAEMRDDPISRVMHGLLTAYSQYHNRKYRQMGHLFQGRYKAILCQSDRYLAELVRYNVRRGLLDGAAEAAIERRLQHMRAGTPYVAERRFPDGAARSSARTRLP